MDKEMKNMRELSIDEMDKVAGGMIIQGKDGKYWVYSDDGKEMLPNAFYDLATAQQKALDAGWSNKVVNPFAPAEEDPFRYNPEGGGGAGMLL
jgi:hypothetical protein